MKLYIKLNLSFLLISSLAQAQEYYSAQYTYTKYSQIAIEFKNNNVYFERHEIVGDESICQQVFNLSDLNFDDHKLDVSTKDSGTYWYIPFEKFNPIQLYRSIVYEVSCTSTYFCSHGECGWNSQDQCKCGSGPSNPCFVIICDQPNWGVRFRGPGIIVKADTVFQKIDLDGTYRNDDKDYLVHFNIISDGHTATILKTELGESDTTKELIYNFTPFDFECLNEGDTTENDTLVYKSRENYKSFFIPFHHGLDDPPCEEVNGNVYYECCGGCNPGSCDWYRAGGCTSCKCNDYQNSTVNCIVTRHTVKLIENPKKSGGLIIGEIENVIVKE